MRIAILQGAFLPVPALRGGAVEKMWYSLSKRFCEKGHEVLYVSRKVPELPHRETFGNLTHIRIQGYDTPSSGVVLKYLDLLYSIRARQVLSEEYDVIISNTFWAPIVLPNSNKRICLVDVQRMPKGQISLYKKVARLRANSEVVAEAIKKELPKALHPKVKMIPNPLPFIPDEETNPSKKEKLILYVGRIHPEKGIELLIAAHKQLTHGFTLQIVGPWDIAAGGGGNNYLEKLQKIADPGNVLFTGPIYDMNLLNQYYRRASVFVYPSVAEKGETFGLAPLEAMAWGCVPVVSDLACFKDFIIDGSNGLVFDHRSEKASQLLAEQISKLLNEDTYRTELAAEALKVRMTHSISAIADQFLAEFECIKDM